MGYFVVILLAISAVYCFFGAFILKIASQKRVLGGKPDNFVYKGLVSLEKKLEHSGSSLTVSQYLAFQFIIPVLAGVLSGLFQDSILTAILLMVSIAMLPRLILAVKKSSEDRKFEDRYARALSQMASALHSGRTIGQAVDTVATCDLLDPQTQKEFMQISSKLKLGHPIPETFEEYAEETGSKDAKDVATAITIMLEVGGDPGKAIEKLQRDIENRLLYRRKRESMMTEGRIISIASDVVPILVLAGTAVLMPGTLQSYFESPLLLMVFAGMLVTMLVGSIVVHHMLDDKADVS